MEGELSSHRENALFPVARKKNVATCAPQRLPRLRILSCGPSAKPSVEVLHCPALVLINGKVITVDKGFSIQQAVAIRDEKILAVGTTAKIRALAGPTTKVIDLKGRTVIPGLIDSHMHFLRAGFRWRQEVRLDRACSVQEILNLIEKRVSQVSPGEWILTFGGWDASQLQERRAPTKAELDRVAPNNPVMLRILLPHPSTHFAVLNSAGLKAASPLCQ